MDLARAAEVQSLVTRSISGHLTQRMQDHHSSVSGDEQRHALARVVDLAGVTARDEHGADDRLGGAEKEKGRFAFAKPALSCCNLGAGEEIRTLDVHLGKVALYH